MNGGTPDRWNSRLMSKLSILSKFENHVTELKNMRCRNSRHMPKLPTDGTPDPQGFGKLAVGLWSSISDMSGMNTGHVRYDQDSEPSKSVEVRHVGTPDPCRDSRLTNPRTTGLQLLDKYRTRPVLPDQQENQLALLSLKYSKLTWVGLSTYETLSINMMHLS